MDSNDINRPIPRLSMFHFFSMTSIDVSGRNATVSISIRSVDAADGTTLISASITLEGSFGHTNSGGSGLINSNRLNVLRAVSDAVEGDKYITASAYNV